MSSTKPCKNQLDSRFLIWRLNNPRQQSTASKLSLPYLSMVNLSINYIKGQGNTLFD